MAADTRVTRPRPVVKIPPFYVTVAALDRTCLVQCARERAKPGQRDQWSQATETVSSRRKGLAWGSLSFKRGRHSFDPPVSSAQPC